MPNLTATQLLKAIVKAQNGVMGAAEFRDYEHSTAKRLLSNENEVFRSVNALKKSDEQPTKAILFNRIYTASQANKSASHSAAAFADSFEKDIAYIKRVQTFKVSYKQADNNQFGYDEILQSEIKNKLMSMYEDISTYVIDWLETNRTQVAEDSLISFDSETVTDADVYHFENPSTEKDFFFDNLKAVMRKNKYRGMLDVIGDQRNAREFRRIAAQGSANSTNLSYTIPGLDYIEEPIMNVSASGLVYAWQKGLVGMTTWNEPLNRRGQGDPGNNEGLFTTFRDPILGHLHDLHVVRGVADTSTAAGNVQDVVDEYEMTTIFTVQGAYQSTANATPIFKVVQQ